MNGTLTDRWIHNATRFYDILTFQNLYVIDDDVTNGLEKNRAWIREEKGVPDAGTAFFSRLHATDF